MDVYAMEPALSSSGLMVVRVPSPDITPDVSFDTGSEFNLNFFDNPDDSNTQGCYSDPGSVGSTSASSPPPTPKHCPMLTGVSTSNGGGIGTQQPSGNVVIKQEPQFVVADSAASCGGPAKSFVPCKVCGDKASGYHYGVTSCEGCKGFFRRSIQKQIEYRCLRDGKCLVIRLNRNRCQYCRFKKCLQVGMSRDSVRYGRVPKRSREMCVDETSRGSLAPPLTPPCGPGSVGTPGDGADRDADTGVEMALYDVILCVSQAHRAHCGYTEELTGVTRRPVPMPNPGQTTDDCEVASSASDHLEQPRVWLWQQYAGRITPAVQRVVEFAKRVPGFCELSQDDQLILIKLGFFEIWLTHVARTTTESSIMFDDGTYLTRHQMEVIYDSDFVSALLQFTNALNSLNLSDTELGLFSALILLASDRSGVTGHKSISRARERLVEALRVQIARSRPSAATLLVPALEAIIPELRSLGTRHCKHLDWFRDNWSLLRLPPLFAEIFDIPKCEEDLQ